MSRMSEGKIQETGRRHNQHFAFHYMQIESTQYLNLYHIQFNVFFSSKVASMIVEYKHKLQRLVNNL